MGIPWGGPDVGGPIVGSVCGGMNGGAPETGGIPWGPPGAPIGKRATCNRENYNRGKRQIQVRNFSNGKMNR